MLNLSLHGSSINLNKSSVSSARSLNQSGRNGKYPSERINHTPHLQKSSDVRHRGSQNPNQDVHLNLAESVEDCPVLQRATGPAGDDRPSPTDVAQSQKHVSDWLNTCLDSDSANWEQIELLSITSSLRHSPGRQNMHRKSQVDPELRVCLDSLDVTQDTDREIAVRDAEDVSQMTMMAEEPELAELSEANNVPPSCQARPVSDSLISERVMDVNEAAQPVKNESGAVEQQNAARAIQGFWRRHRCRKLAAQAALRRMMAEQKRRMDETVRSQGMPLRAVQARQKQMNEKRVLEEHRKKIKALRARHSEPSGPDDGSPVSTGTKGTKIDSNATRRGDILQKPASPMITPRHGRHSVGSNRSMVSQNESEQEEVGEVLTERTLRDDDTEHAVTERGKNQDELQSQGRSTMDEIIQDLGRLGSMEDTAGSELTTGRSKAYQPTWASTFDEKGESRSKGWTEMCKYSQKVAEINRVLSEPDEVEHYEYQVAEKPSRRTSETVNPMESPYTTYLNQPSKKQTVRNTADLTKQQPTLLTKRNLQEHRRRFSTSARLRRTVKEELESSVNLVRSHLDRMLPVHNSTHSTGLNQTAPMRQASITSCPPRGSQSALSRSVHYTNNAIPVDQLGDSFYSVQSHAYTDPVCTNQLPNENDLAVNALKMQLEHQVRIVQRLQSTVDQQRELSSRQLRDTQREAEQRLESIKADYEATIKRNYSLIDELIEEKKALHAKCETLMSEMKTMAQKSEEKLKVIEDRHKVELRKTEAKLAAAEKLRREKWEAEKTKQMKEMTVRGMESELAQLIAKHQAEMRQVRQSCAEQVQAADIRAYQAYTGQIEEIRQTLAREKEEACARERETATQRLEKTLNDERAALDQQRRRLMSEVAEERERLALSCAREREEVDRGRRNLESRLEQLTAKYEQELARQREDFVKKHEKELDELQQRERAEREAWEEHTKSVLEAQCAARENGLRDQLKRERDRQLEAAVRRLEAELNETRMEVEREAEGKIKRIREKLGAEITELERSERQAMEKYCEMKTKLLDKEQESDRLRVQLQQKEQEMHDIRALYEKLNQERQNMSDVVRQEFADRLVTLEEENRTVKRELAEAKARLAKEKERHEADLDALRKTNADELESVHQKIKEAIKRKDEKTNLMRKHFEQELEKRVTEVDEANRRADHLEELLDQQRKQFLQTVR